MSYRVDFADIKAKVSIVQVLDWLGIQLKPSGHDSLRGPCPFCGSDKRGFAVTPSKNLWNAFCGCGKGTIIDLVAFHHKCGTREAAVMLQDHFLGGNSKPVSPGGEHGSPPIKEKRQEQGTVPPNVAGKVDFADLAAKLAKVRQRLQYEHEYVQAIGLSPEVAKRFDIGYCPSGIMRGRICFPLYLDGVHVAYTGLATAADQSPLMLFPSNMEQIVVVPTEAPQPQVNDVRAFLRVVK